MTILVAEDNAANREVLREALSIKGHTIVEAVDGQELLEKLEELSPDVILLDIQMPRLDGYTAIRRIRSDDRFRRLKVIALTALAMQGESEKALAAGFDGYIAKPISLAKLYEQLKQVTGT